MVPGSQHFPGVLFGHEEFPVYAAGGGAALYWGMPFSRDNGNQRKFEVVGVAGKIQHTEGRPGSYNDSLREPIDH